jgi:hypothetical protein
MIRKLRAREPNWAALMKSIEDFSSLDVDLRLWWKQALSSKERDSVHAVRKPVVPQNTPTTKPPAGDVQENKETEDMPVVSEEDLAALKDLHFDEQSTTPTPTPRQENPVTPSAGIVTKPPVQEVIHPECRPVNTKAKGSSRASGMPAEKMMQDPFKLPVTIPCSCGGFNVNCIHCDGKGYREKNPPSAEGRSIYSKKPHDSVSKKATRKRNDFAGGQQKEKIKPAFISCPYCHCKLKNGNRRLEKHLNICPKAESIKHVKSSTNSEDGTDESADTQAIDLGRHLDATRDSWQLRETVTGQWGSHPSHDGMGDEDKP